MKTDKIFKLVTIVLFVSFALPSFALASWWNPISWSVWNIFRPTTHVQQVQIQIATTTPSTSTTTISTETNVKVKQDKPKSGSSTSTSLQKKTVVDSIPKVIQPKATEQPEIKPGPTTLLVNCSSNASTVDVNQKVTWTANASGGIMPYKYSWIGTAISGIETQSVTTQYSGRPYDHVERARIILTSADGQNTNATCSVKVKANGNIQQDTSPISNTITPPVYIPPTPPVLPTCTITPDVSFNDNQNITLNNSQTGYFSVVFDFSSPECWAERVTVSDSVSSASGYLSFTDGHALFAKFSKATGKSCYWLSKFEGAAGNGTITFREGARSGCSAGSLDKWYLNVEVLKDTPAGTKVGICVLSAEDGNGQQIKGLPYCTKTWTVGEAPLPQLAHPVVPIHETANCLYYESDRKILTDYWAQSGSYTLVGNEYGDYATLNDMYSGCPQVTNN